MAEVYAESSNRSKSVTESAREVLLRQEEKLAKEAQIKMLQLLNPAPFTAVPR